MKPPSFNLRHLKALAATVRSGSLSGAAASVGISQPAVSQAISRLEAQAGTKLLERSPGGAVPTDAGILLAARGEAAGATISQAFRSARSGGIGGRAGADQEVSLAQLTALVSLADTGSYAAGAEAAGVAQPSLHRTVADLERLCAVPLVERKGRGIALTDAGQRLARAFRLAAAELQAAVDELAVLAGRDQGAIRIAADDAALERLLPDALARFIGEHPPVLIEVSPGDGAAERLRDGRIDAIVALADALHRPGFTVEPLVEDPLAIVARAGHPLAGAAPGLVRLATFGWALPPAGQSERDLWERMFLDGGLFPPAPSVTCPSSTACFRLVERSDLLTVAPAARIGRDAGKLVTIGDPLPGPRKLVLVTRPGWAPTPAQAAFLDEVRAGGREVLAF